MARNIKKWSAMMAEKEEHRSKVYREGSRFVYDGGDLPEGLSGVGAGCVLCLQRPHGISAAQMPGTAEDWIVVGGSGGGGSVVVDTELSGTSTNPVQNRVVKRALENKMDNDQAFKTINGQSIRGSGNISIPGCQCEVPFTSALRDKLAALPVITLNGNTLTINGRSFVLTPEEPSSDPADYYAGFTSGTKAEFAALTAEQLKALAEGNMITDKGVYTHTVGQNTIFFLMWKSGCAPQSGSLTSGGVTSPLSASDFTNGTTFNATHDPVTIDGVQYTVAGIRNTEFNAEDSFTVNFQ